MKVDDNFKYFMLSPTRSTKKNILRFNKNGKDGTLAKYIQDFQSQNCTKASFPLSELTTVDDMSGCRNSYVMITDVKCGLSRVTNNEALSKPNLWKNKF